MLKNGVIWVSMLLWGSVARSGYFERASESPASDSESPLLSSRAFGLFCCGFGALQGPGDILSRLQIGFYVTSLIAVVNTWGGGWEAGAMGRWGRGGRRLLLGRARVGPPTT